MNAKCANCRLLFCDFASKDCQLKANEVLTLRPDLIFPLAVTSEWSKYKRFYWRHKPKLRAKYREANNEASRRYRSNNRLRRLQIERNYRDKHRDAINERRRMKRKMKNEFSKIEHGREL
jgi:hypothetical protein